MPHYADYELSNSDESIGAAGPAEETKTIELPSIAAVFEKVNEIVPPKPLDQEHTVAQAKPK